MQGFSKLRAFVNESQFFLGAVAVSANIRVVSGRYHAHFPDIAISTTAKLDVGELFTWLERHKNQIGRSL